MGGRDFCCVVGCSNRRSETNLSFYGIPKKPEKRRKAWIKATGRQCHGKDKFVVTEYTRICGAHFVKGCKNNNPLDVDYIPSVNLPITLVATPFKERNSATSTKAREYTEAVETAVKNKNIRYCRRKKLVVADIDINDVQNEVEVHTSEPPPSDYDLAKACLPKGIDEPPLDHSDHSYATKKDEVAAESVSLQTDTLELGCCLFTACSIKDSSTQIPENIPLDKGVQIDSFDPHVGKNLTDLKLKNQQKVINSLNEKVVELTKECSEAKKKVFCAKNVLISAEKVQFYTGLPNIGTFNALFQYLKPKAEQLTFWRGKNTKTPKKIGIQKLPLEDQFFATLVRLRLGLSVEDLSDRFGVSMSCISSLFNTWVRFLRLELEALFPYPSAEQVKGNLPEAFKKFPNTRLVIDCTEIYVQKPSALKAQRQTWSNYKHRNTHKILVGVTPDGTVVFVSSLFGGSASDKFIVKHSGLLQLIQPGDNIMADRGFDIRLELKKLGAELNIPHLEMEIFN